MSKAALARPSMPAMIVPSTCAACGKAGKFIEFKAEPCTPGSASLPAGNDDDKTDRSPSASEGERRYGFRCLACKAIVPELVAADGRKHFWTDGQHLEA